jgi:protein-S-isoprenylcysteine O-methyltransferase Ste14
MSPSKFKTGLLSIALFGLFLFLLIPWVCVKIDRRFSISLPIFLMPLGLFIFPFALVLLIECWRLFLIVGKGTPSPVAPSENLVTEGPYKYTRNPMVIGLFLVLISLGLILRSPSFFVFLLLLLPLGILFIKLYEEKDLERRFGEAYIAYKAKTPFLIPTVRCNATLKSHIKAFIFALSLWLAFFLAGLPSSYYRELSSMFMAVFCAVATLILIPIIALFINFMDNQSKLKDSIILAFYLTFPLFILDYIYCGLYLKEGIGFVLSYWYLSIFYIIPWAICPLIGLWLDKRVRQDEKAI